MMKWGLLHYSLLRILPLRLTPFVSMNANSASLFQLADSATNYSVVLDPLTLLVQQQLTSWFGQGDYLTQAANIFSATAGSEAWNVNAQSLQQSVLNGTYNIRLEVRSGSELGGAFGAYSATGTTGTPTIYLNGDWLSTASQGDIQSILLEELGHSFDHVLNSGVDSQGDEGEVFANLVLNTGADLAPILQQDDHRVVTLDGVNVAVENGFGGTDVNGDSVIDSLRMITWNVIGLDSNKPETSGPDTFMVGLRVNADADGLNNLVVKLVEDNGKDIFGSGLLIGDTTFKSDGDDGVDQIRLINKLTYTGETIAANSYQDFYFNVEVERSLSSFEQIQPFHFEVFEDIGGDGIADDGEVVKKLEKFSWLADSAAANTPLYLIVEKYVSQARNNVENQLLGGGGDHAAAIRVQDYTTDTAYTDSTGNYPTMPLTVFVGQDLNVRVEAATSTGYPQLTVQTVFANNIFKINHTEQYYGLPLENTTYQQGLGSGDHNVTFGTGGWFDVDNNQPIGDPNTSLYANPAGWNPATHSLMITSAPPKAGDANIITDYNVTIVGTGSSRLNTLILDASGSSFHYNADVNSGVLGKDYIIINSVFGIVQGTVGVDNNGDKLSDTGSGLSGIQITLTGDVNKDGTPDTLITTTDASGNYRFSGYWKDKTDGSIATADKTTDLSATHTWVDGIQPNSYTVTEQAVISGYSDVAEYANGVIDGLTNNTVTVTLDTNATVFVENGVTYGAATANFVEGRPDLQLTMTPSSLFPQLGGQVTYTLVVSNTSSADAPYVEIKDLLPSGLTFSSVQVGSVTLTDSNSDGVYSDESGSPSTTMTYNPTTGIWTLPNGVDPNSTQTLTITATLTSSSPVTNFAEITAVKTSSTGSSLTDPDSTVNNNNSGTRTPFEDDEAKVTVEAKEADLSVITTVTNVSDPGDRPNVGETMEFKIIITNSGPDTATNVVVTDYLPSGINPASIASIGSITTSAGTFTFNNSSWATATQGLWTIPSLANGATATVTFRATVDEAKAFTNFVEVTSADQFDPDSQPAGLTPDADRVPDQDDEASALVMPHAVDLSVLQTVNNRFPDEGGTVTYTVLVTNAGPDTASSVVIKDYLGSGLDSSISNIKIDGVAAGANATYSGGVLTWSNLTIASGSTVRLNFDAVVEAGGTNYTATAEVFSVG